MSAPTLVGYAESTWTDALGTAETSGTLTWQVGDLVVVFGGTENGAFALNTPTASGSGLSFTLTAQVGSTASDAHAYLWLAIATVASSGTISAAPANAGTLAMRGISVWQYRGSDGLGATVASLSASSAKAVSLPRGGANSMVGFGAVDWNAVAAGTALTPAGGTVRENSLSTGRAAVVVGDWGDQGAAGTTNYGYTGGGTPKNYGFAWEVLGTAGAGSGDATITSSTASGSGDLAAPLLSAGSATTAAPISASGGLAAPNPSAAAVVAAPALLSSGGMVTPAGSAGAKVSAPAMLATGGLVAPAIAAGSSGAMPVVPLGATGDIPAPTRLAGASVVATSLAATGDLSAPGIEQDQSATPAIDLPTELVLADYPTTLLLAATSTSLTLAERPTTMTLADHATTLSLDG